MEVIKVLVVGAGQMGAGIAQVAAQAGFKVVLIDIEDSLVQRGVAAIGRNLERSVARGRLSAEEKEAILGRVIPGRGVESGADADLAIEAAIERLDTKRTIFQQLDAVLRPEAILATNTSSLSITQIGAFTGRPDQCLGMHFFNPVPMMSLVEVIRGLATSDQTAETAVAVSRRLGKTPVFIKDSFGFAVNRMIVPMINEAIFAFYEGLASAEDIDTVMKLGANHPLGPLELADLIGLDTILAIMEVLYDGFGDSKYRPCPLLRQYVHAGWLGRKTGRGFYQY